MTPDHAAPVDQYAAIRFEGGVLTTSLVGPTLGEHEGAVIAYMVREALEATTEPVKHVVLDFSRVSFVNSAMIGACVTIRNAANTTGASTVLFRMAREIEAVFKLCRFNKLFGIARDDAQLAKMMA